MSKETETTIKVIQFDGKQSSWVVWEEKFLARALIKGYQHILLSSDKEHPIPKESDDVQEEGNDVDESGSPIKKTQPQAKPNAKQLAKNKLLNNQAYGDLILSMDATSPTGLVAFNIVKSTKTTIYPNGNARIAWQNLKKKYSPTTTFALSMLHRKYNNASLRKGSDPDVFMNYLYDLRMQMSLMNLIYTDQQFMLHVLANIGEDYEMVQYMMDHR